LESLHENNMDLKISCQHTRQVKSYFIIIVIVEHHLFDELSNVAQTLSWSIMCAKECIAPHRRPSKRRVPMSGEDDDPRGGWIDDSLSDDCNVAGP
jgi:hypothetical protein